MDQASLIWGEEGAWELGYTVVRLLMRSFGSFLKVGHGKKKLGMNLTLSPSSPICKSLPKGSENIHPAETCLQGFIAAL